MLRIFLFLACSLLIPLALSAQATLGISFDETATVTAVTPGSAGAKAGLQVGDVIIGLNNHSLTQGAGEIRATLAKTHPGSLLPISIRRAGHVMSVFAFPPADPNAPPTPNAGVPATPGHYNCLTFTFVAGGLGEAPSSLYTGIDLLPGGEYRTLQRTGRFHTDRNSDRLVFDSGPLSEAVAHFQRDDKGQPKIAFVQSENPRGINGHEIDRGPTACYLRR